MKIEICFKRKYKKKLVIHTHVWICFISDSLDECWHFVCMCAIVFELKKKCVIDKKPKIRYLNISMLI